VGPSAILSELSQLSCTNGKNNTMEVLDVYVRVIYKWILEK